jgi:hypothetical protein
LKTLIDRSKPLVDFGEPHVQLGSELCAELDPKLGQPLADLCVETGEVEIVELAQLGALGQVHLVGDWHMSLSIVSPLSPLARMNQSTSSFATCSPS